MVGKIKHLVVVIILLMGTNAALAQFGLSGGMSVLKGFEVQKPYIGMHIGGEIPRDDQISLYARLSIFAFQTDTIKSVTSVYAVDPANTFPFSKTVGYFNKMNYTLLEGGTRYYLGNGYDSGFGAYGGSTVLIAVNFVKRNYDGFEQEYELSSSDLPKGKIFNLGFGLSGGIKNTFPGIGTLYFDLGLAYLILNQANNQTAVIAANNGGLYSQLLFNFSLGFRKEFY
jgi:hypothetical protein